MTTHEAAFERDYTRKYRGNWRRETKAFFYNSVEERDLFDALSCDFSNTGK
jgi:hypothetical protein